MNLWALIGGGLVVIIIAVLLVWAVSRMVVYGIFREPPLDDDCGDAGGMPADVNQAGAAVPTAPETGSGLRAG